MKKYIAYIYQKNWNERILEIYCNDRESAFVIIDTTIVKKQIETIVLVEMEQ